MSHFGFASFRNLIKTVDRKELFDAVKPELQDYAKFKYGGRKKKNEAYLEIFALAHKAAGEGGYPPDGQIEKNIVERMGKGRNGKGDNYLADPIHAERLYFFFLFSDERGGPTFSTS